MVKIFFNQFCSGRRTKWRNDKIACHPKRFKSKVKKVSLKIVHKSGQILFQLCKLVELTTKVVLKPENSIFLNILC